MAPLLFASRQTINFSTSAVNPDYLPCFRGAKSNRMRPQQQHAHPYSTFPSEMISQIYFDLHLSQTSYLYRLPIHSLILFCFLPRLPGLDMSLADFCQIYQIGDPILQKFVKNGFVQSWMLRFVQIAELKEMEFLLGEIAALKDAIEMWSIAA